MIDTKAIRSKILDLALHGLLTEQLPEDGTAEELYQQIQAEKQELIKAGKIKKEKPLPPISEDEILFEIPRNWKNIRFGTIINLQSGQDLTKQEYSNNECGIPYITGASNYNSNGTLIINRWTNTPKAFAEKGDILLSCKGTVGKIAILNIDKVHIARQIMGIRTYCVDNAFVTIFLRSIVNGIVNAQKGLIPGIERKDILTLICPLPPLAEQKRIVGKIEQTFSVLDTIDDLQTKYANNLSALKSKLIDAAIQGKLTEQLPEDGTAEDLYRQIQAEKQALIKAGKIKKEKPLTEITADEVPFEIPANWKWVRLPELCTMPITDGTHQTPTYAEKETGIPFLSSKDVTKGKINWSSIKYITKDLHEVLYRRIAPQKNDILLAKNGTTGVAALVENDEIFDIYVTCCNQTKLQVCKSSVFTICNQFSVL